MPSRYLFLHFDASMPGRQKVTPYVAHRRSEGKARAEYSQTGIVPAPYPGQVVAQYEYDEEAGCWLFLCAKRNGKNLWDCYPVEGLPLELEDDGPIYYERPRWRRPADRELPPESAAHFPGALASTSPVVLY